MPHRNFSIIVGGVIVVAALLLQFFVASAPHSGTWLARVNALWYDLRFQLLPPKRSPLMPIVIIDLDEFTQQREGRWPWDRAKVAQLVEALRGQGTALIGFDVVFSEPGGNAVQTVREQLQTQTAHKNQADNDLGPERDDKGSLIALADEVDLQALLRQLDVLSPQLDGDALFAQHLGPDTVLGFFLHNDGASAGQLPPAPLLLDSSAPAPDLLQMNDYTANLAQLNFAMPASGFIVAIPDGDGIVRRMPLVMRHQNEVYNALSVEIVRLAIGAPWTRLQTQKINDDTVVLTGVNFGNLLQVPVDERGQMLVPYRGRAGSFPTVSATRLLQGDADPNDLAALQGAIALIGTSALGLADLRTTPLQTSYPGVEVHANVIDTMLHAFVHQDAAGAANGNGIFSGAAADAFYFTPDWAPGALVTQIVVFGLFLALWMPNRAPRYMLLGTLTCAGLVLGVNLWLWQSKHLALPVALVLLTVLAVGGWNMVFGYFISTRQKQVIQNLFGEYVPAEHVAVMVENPKAISLEGVQKEMTVLFADIRNFTAISEALSPTELKSALNRYLSAVTEVIFAHQGTIDKYVGDLVMAFWNAPLDDAKHATHAVHAALAMQERVQALRVEFAQEGLPQFHIGIGLNTGLMNVGDMGSVYRRAYTVLGDAVNLAARLESLTSFYQLPILVSDTTRAQAGGFIYRTVDQVRVKGRQTPLFISQPIGRTGQLKAGAQAQLALYADAFAAYQDGTFDAAQRLFRQLAQEDPNEPLYQLYLQRLQQLAADNWDPVFTHDNK